MAGVMVYGSGDGRVVILPVTDSTKVSASADGTNIAIQNAYTDGNADPPTTTTVPSTTSSTQAPTTEYGGITGVRSVVETPYTVVATVTTSIEGQTTATPIPITTVVQAGTIVIIQPDPPDEDKTTNLVAILAGTLGCVVGMVLVGLIIFLTRRAGKRQRRRRLKEDEGGVAYPNHFDEPKPLSQPEMIIGDGLIATPFEFVPPIPEKDRDSTLIGAPPERSSFVAPVDAVGGTTHQYPNRGGSPTHQDTTQSYIQYSSPIAFGGYNHSSQANVEHSGIGTHAINEVFMHDDGGPVRTFSMMNRTVEGGIGHPPPYSGHNAS